MAQLLPMSDEIMASLRQADWIARHAMRGDIRSGRGHGRARSSWCPDRHLRGPSRQCCSQRDLVCRIRSSRSSRLHRRQLGKLLEDLLGNHLGVALDGDGDFLGQPDTVGVDIDLDDLGILRPVIDAVTRQGRERVEPRAQAPAPRRPARSVPSPPWSRCSRAGRRTAGASPGSVVVLVAAADRRSSSFRPALRRRNARRQTTPAPFRMTGNLASTTAWPPRRSPAPPDGRSSRRSAAARYRSPGSSNRAGR